ncbi:MAG: lytic transglycosylase domain-containing protein [Comamonas sp.]|nr:lytic transglycosylase domain-containing protein [Candidatus Comamonas equi]
MTKPRNWVTAVRTFASDVTEGFIEITHNSFALLGLAVCFLAVALLSQPQLRTKGETQLRAWLQERHIATVGFTPEPAAVERTTAANPKELPKEQASVAYWISKKYRVAAEPIAAIVAEAYAQGEKQRIDPTLILAVMAVESSFNPFAQSSVGAQGLMQVMTRVHTAKYENFGGNHAAFDPVSNMRVGAAILKEYIDLTGSVEGGLRYYVGAANLESDGGYGAKVLAEHRRLRQIAGKSTPTTVIKRNLVAKRQVTPVPSEDTGAVAASSVPDTTQVALSSNL